MKNDPRRCARRKRVDRTVFVFPGNANLHSDKRRSSEGCHGHFPEREREKASGQMLPTVPPDHQTSLVTVRFLFNNIADTNQRSSQQTARLHNRMLAYKTTNRNLQQIYGNKKQAAYYRLNPIIKNGKLYSGRKRAIGESCRPSNDRTVRHCTAYLMEHCRTIVGPL